MREKQPIRLDSRIHLIDGFDMDIPERTGTYVLNEEELTLIETGPSPSVKYIKKGLEALGYTLGQVKYIIVTHIHLDHAGGAGFLLQSCPNATLIVHPKGFRHLAEPKKLAAGARAIYGDNFSDFFDPIIPVPEERMVTKNDGETLRIGDDCTLTFYDTPGHAKHHFSIYDPVSNGLFTGDTAGIRYKQLINDGINFFLPSTSPNHFDPNDMRDAIRRIRGMELDRIYYGHFGMTEDVTEALIQVSAWLDIFMELAEEVLAEEKGYDVLAKRMFQKVKNHLHLKGVSNEHDVFVLINLDMQVSALGIIDYFKKIKH